MANYGPRLPWAFHDGPDPEVAFSDHDWVELQRSLGAEISVKARAQLVALSNQYLVRVRAERNAATESDVARIASHLLRELEPFFDFARRGGRLPAHRKSGSETNKRPRPERRDIGAEEFGESGRPKDAQVEFEHRLEQELSEKAVEIAVEELRLSDGKIPEEIASYLDNRRIALELNLRLVVVIAAHLHRAMQRIGDGKSINHDLVDLPGLKPGQAFDAFLLQIRGWAEMHRLPKGWKSGQQAGRLARMVEVLNRMFPKDLRENRIASATALAKRAQRLSTKRDK